MSVSGIKLLPCVVVLGQDDNLHGHVEQFRKYGGIKMHTVVLVTGKDGVVKDNEAGRFVLSASEKERQTEAVKLRLAKNGDHVAHFGGGTVRVMRKPSLEINRSPCALAWFD